MVKAKTYGYRNRSQTQSVIRTLRPQAGRGIRRCCPQGRTGERTRHHISERRSGAGNPQSLKQSHSSSRGTITAAGRVHGQKSLQLAPLVLLMAFLAGCGAHHRTDTANVPPPPPPATTTSIPHAPVPNPRPTPEERPSATTPTSIPSPAPRRESEGEIIVPPNAKVIYHEVGWASWYGPGFNKRKGANGEVFDTEKMTAAHRTLPLNSIVRVTD